MTTLLDDPGTGTTDSAARRLRTTMAAVRVSLSWLGVRKTLTAEQKNQAADTFGAVGDYLSVGKKLLDTRQTSWTSGATLPCSRNAKGGSPWRRNVTNTHWPHLLRGPFPPLAPSPKWDSSP